MCNYWFLFYSKLAERENFYYFLATNDKKRKTKTIPISKYFLNIFENNALSILSAWRIRNQKSLPLKINMIQFNNSKIVCMGDKCSER